MRILFISVLFLIGAGAASAAPLVYSEAVSGDLSAGDTLTFGVGENTVSGTVSMTYDFEGSDFDDFSFIIPDGLELIDATYSVGGLRQSAPGNIEFFSLSGSIIGRDGFFVGSGGTALLVSRGVQLADAVTVSIYDRSPLAPDLYRFVNGAGINIDPAVTVFTDYTLTFNVAGNVSEIPVPGAFLLMIPGLIGLFAIGKKSS